MYEQTREHCTLISIQAHLYRGTKEKAIAYLTYSHCDEPFRILQEEYKRFFLITPKYI